ncbi:uncharacterized protein LOC130956045 isoform X1 [Arachis stenosperma]|uniref:uncharacterized protein LOC130956045 isoform X1 n=1 Tax=Arachis stenosperma TaxID=217475 RepID=UPI0025ABAEDB|nr:uncharacterized protein LOC130956045 isoform X1 [Arachis stenosperma]
MGDLGKTALAQLVYNAAKDQNLFQKYIWVCVSENFEVKTVLKTILESLKKDAGGDSLEALQQKLREALNGQNYMLVLDDVWNEDHLKWSDLRLNYFQKMYQRWIEINVVGIELLVLLLVWNTSDVITSLNLVGAPFQSLQYLPRKEKVLGQMTYNSLSNRAPVLRRLLCLDSHIASSFSLFIIKFAVQARALSGFM